MERESLLVTLIVLLGGLVLQSVAAWPARTGRDSSPARIERLLWLGLWRPVASAVTVAAWLCGWAWSQPDPVPHRVGWFILIAPLPFMLVGLRACARAVWSLRRSPRNYGIVTVGLFRPKILVAADVATALDERAIEAALAHERAHVRHRDPLRIWLALLVTDLQWPWGAAQRRLADWLAALECARDDEARAAGAQGADLAAAVLGSLRYQLRGGPLGATLIGRPDALPARIARLLRPLPQPSPPRRAPSQRVAGAVLTLSLLAAVAAGHWCGERIIAPLLALSYTVSP
jgi:hypothetical protein